MKNVQQAVDYFNQGRSCSQAIVMSYGPDLGLTSEIGMKVSAAFGGGIARQAETCGAVSGALMMLGLTLDANRENLKESAYILAQEFISKFSERNRSIVCKSLLGVDISTPEGKQQAKEKDLHIHLCSKYVQDAAEILEEMIAKK